MSWPAMGGSVDDTGVSKQFWNTWNAEQREHYQGDVSRRQAEVVRGWLSGRSGLTILDAGCGTGWLSEQLTEFGQVVGTDLADEVVARAQQRVPQARFVAGDVMTVDVGTGFDVVVSLEVLSHVEDQLGFLRRLHDWLRPGGELMIATQNKPVLARFNNIPPPKPGQLRRWVDRTELGELLAAAGFHVERMFVVSPKSDHGLMRVVAKAARMTRTSRVLERIGFGWTIMALATTPSS